MRPGDLADRPGRTRGQRSGDRRGGVAPRIGLRRAGNPATHRARRHRPRLRISLNAKLEPRRARPLHRPPQGDSTGDDDHAGNLRNGDRHRRRQDGRFERAGLRPCGIRAGSGTGSPYRPASSRTTTRRKCAGWLGALRTRSSTPAFACPARFRRIFPPGWAGCEVAVRDVSGIAAGLQKDRLWVVEGAGGILVPLNDREMMTDLIAHLGLPAVIASRSGLGDDQPHAAHPCGTPVALDSGRGGHHVGEDQTLRTVTPSSATDEPRCCARSRPSVPCGRIRSSGSPPGSPTG